MPTVISVSETSLISSDRDCREPGPGAVVVPDTVFQALRQLALTADGADSLLTLFVQKGSEVIRVRNYVGLLALADGIQLEILPKIEDDDQARSVLLSMLRYLRHSPFRTFTNAHTQATRLPLWDVFVTAFADALAPLIRQGMQRAYVSVETNERFWKGKFQAARQQRENAHYAERLAVAYDVLTADMPPNRILKTTLLALQRQPLSGANQQLIRQLLWVLDEVPVSLSVVDDLNAVRRASRLFDRYKPALRWAETLLNGCGYGVRTGCTTDLSLLFPMARVFEDYVAHGIRTYWTGADEVLVQESSTHLVDEHVGTPKFKLRPDILIRQAGRTFVLDTKWKRIDGAEAGTALATGNYGIEQADLYQLYAYGKKYAADDLFLIYPANETFRQPLPVFGYDADTRLHVVPFDLTNTLPNEVEKLAGYALSF